MLGTGDAVGGLSSAMGGLSPGSHRFSPLLFVYSQNSPQPYRRQDLQKILAECGMKT